MRKGMKLQSLLPEFLGQIYSLFCQNRYSYGVAFYRAVLRSPLPLTCLQTRNVVTWATAGGSARAKKCEGEDCPRFSLSPTDPATSEALCLGQLSTQFCLPSHLSLQCCVSPAPLLIKANPSHDWVTLEGLYLPGSRYW
jgi:hypothetical protein